MKFRILIYTLSVFLFSCEQTPESEKSTEKVEEVSDFEKQLRQEIEIQLALKATDKYTYEIFREDLSIDTIKDAVIIINMLESALKDDTMSAQTHLKNVGAYNHVFTYDGKSKKFSKAPPIGSSAEFTPTINFINLTSPAYKDFVVEYRINDSGFYNYYTMHKGLVYLVFSAPYFSEIKSEHAEAIYHDVIEGKQSLARDILLYKGIVPEINLKDTSDIFNYYPEIENSGEPYLYFFYDSKRLKYVTPQKPN